MCKSNSIESSFVSQALLDSKWKQAIVEKYKALMNNNTWSLVPYQKGMHVVGNKWVFRVKYKPNGTIQRHKACLVSKGFQQTPDIDYFETFSLIVKPSTIRVILSLVVSRAWDIKQVYVNNVFLNGDS